MKNEIEPILIPELFIAIYISRKISENIVFRF